MHPKIKKFLKSSFMQNVIAYIVFLYVKLIYYTTKWEYVFPDDYSIDYYKNIKRTILVAWHDKIMGLPHISPFQFNKTLHALVSPHNDGRIIANTMKLLGYNIIDGSSNKNPVLAVKHIMKVLQNNGNVVITPDGPRGPRHQMKGNLIEIAKKTNASIICFTASPSRYKRLNSWDKLIFPLPFGRITIRFSTHIDCTKKTQLTDEELTLKLTNLG